MATRNKVTVNQEKTEETQGTVTVSYGINMLSEQNLVGMTVSEIRERFSGPFNIDPKVETRVNGELVNNQYQAQPNDVIEFVKLAGSKGC